MNMVDTQTVLWQIFLLDQMRNHITSFIVGLDLQILNLSIILS